MGEWRYNPNILYLGTIWRYDVSELHTPAASLVERAAQHPLDGRLGEPQGWSGWCGKVKNFAPAGNRALATQPVAIPTELS
jgi:hypothetical protein